MKTYWNTMFTKRDYECTNVVAVKAEKLPQGYDPKIWKSEGPAPELRSPMQYLGAQYANGERFETYGYL